jgi:hypothetical protein
LTPFLNTRTATKVKINDRKRIKAALIVTPTKRACRLRSQAILA